MNGTAMTTELPSEPPSLDGLPMLGELLRLLASPYSFSLRMVREHDDLVRVRLGALNVYLIGHPEMAQQVLRDRSANYTRSGMNEVMQLLLGQGLLTAEGEVWRMQRKLLQPLFSRQRLAELIPHMAAAAGQSVDEWPRQAGGAPLDLAQATSAAAMRVILRTLFAASISDTDIAQLRDSLRTALDHIGLLLLTHGLPRWLPRPGARRFQQALSSIDSTVLRTIDAQRRGIGPCAPLLSTLLEARDLDTGKAMTDRQVRDEVMSFFVAGFETTSTMLAWTLHLLTKHPEVERRVRAEVASEIGSRAPTYDELQRLRYTRQVLLESLRLFSPSWFIPRYVVSDDQIAGRAVRAGAMAIVLVHRLHRHPDFWDAPDEFRPERFAKSALPHHGAYLPFGFGPHRCIGEQFALLEGQLVLAMIMQRFRFWAAPGTQVQPAARVTYHPRSGVPALVAPLDAGVFPQPGTHGSRSGTS